MAEEKRNLEPLDDKDLDLKTKFSGISETKKPGGVVAEVREEIVPKFHKRTESEEKASNLEPIDNRDIDLKAKFSGMVAPEKQQEVLEKPQLAPQKPQPMLEKQQEIPAATRLEFEKEKTKFSKMSIRKEERPAAKPESAGGEAMDLKTRFSMMNLPKKVENPTEENKIESTPGMEISREQEKDQAEEFNPDQASRITIARQVTEKDVSKDARVAARDQDPSSRVETLVRLAELKGIPHAVKVAQHMDDNYTMDEFHDCLLSEELHEALIERGLIQET